MKVYIDAIEDEYYFAVYSNMHIFRLKNEQRLFMGAIYVTYEDLTNNFIQTWNTIVASMNLWPSSLQDMKQMLNDYTILAEAIAEFIDDVDEAFHPSNAILNQFQSMTIDQDISSNGIELADEDKNPEITTIEDIESTPPSRAPTLGY